MVHVKRRDAALEFLQYSRFAIEIEKGMVSESSLDTWSKCELICYAMQKVEID